MSSAAFICAAFGPTGSTGKTTSAEGVVGSKLEPNSIAPRLVFASSALISRSIAWTRRRLGSVEPIEPESSMIASTFPTRVHAAAARTSEALPESERRLPRRSGHRPTGPAMRVSSEDVQRWLPRGPCRPRLRAPQASGQRRIPKEADDGPRTRDAATSRGSPLPFRLHYVGRVTRSLPTGSAQKRESKTGRSFGSSATNGHRVVPLRPCVRRPRASRAPDRSPTPESPAASRAF